MPLAESAFDFVTQCFQHGANLVELRTLDLDLVRFQSSPGAAFGLERRQQLRQVVAIGGESAYDGHELPFRSLLDAELRRLCAGSKTMWLRRRADALRLQPLTNLAVWWTVKLSTGEESHVMRVPDDAVGGRIKRGERKDAEGRTV